MNFNIPLALDCFELSLSKQSVFMYAGTTSHIGVLGKIAQEAAEPQALSTPRRGGVCWINCSGEDVPTLPGGSEYFQPASIRSAAAVLLRHSGTGGEDLVFVRGFTRFHDEEPEFYRRLICHLRDRPRRAHIMWVEEDAPGQPLRGLRLQSTLGLRYTQALPQQSRLEVVKSPHDHRVLRVLHIKDETLVTSPANYVAEDPHFPGESDDAR